MKTFEYNGKKYNFAEDIEPHEDGLYMATLTNEDNIRCELLFLNGKIHRITELD